MSIIKLITYLFFSESYLTSKIKLSEKELLEKFLKTKLNKVRKVEIYPERIEIEKIEAVVETDKSLKELKEMAIVLRQKLDTYESERNMMDVEYSQVSHIFFIYTELSKLCRFHLNTTMLWHEQNTPSKSTLLSSYSVYK